MTSREGSLTKRDEPARDDTTPDMTTPDITRRKTPLHQTGQDSTRRKLHITHTGPDHARLEHTGHDRTRRKPDRTRHVMTRPPPHLTLPARSAPATTGPDRHMKETRPDSPIQPRDTTHLDVTRRKHAMTEQVRIRPDRSSPHPTRLAGNSTPHRPTRPALNMTRLAGPATPRATTRQDLTLRNGQDTRHESRGPGVVPGPLTIGEWEAYAPCEVLSTRAYQRNRSFVNSPYQRGLFLLPWALYTSSACLARLRP